MRNRKGGISRGAVIRSVKIPFLIAISMLLLVQGCLYQSQDKKLNNENPAPMPAAPRQFYIKAGQSEQFTYWGHNITINYISSPPSQVIKVSLDGYEKSLQRELTESPAEIYWEEGSLSFTLKPVVRELREGQEIPIYESTWNTTEIFLEVLTRPPAQTTGDPQI